MSRAGGALAVDAGAPPVDLPQLVVLVRTRRVLRLAARLALLALPVWFTVVIAVIEKADDYSSTHTWIDDHANRGFLIILVVLAVDLVMSAVLRLTGGAGALAARLVPMLRAVPDPVLGTGEDRAYRLLDAGSRSRRARAPQTSWWATAALRMSFVLLVVVVAIPGSMVHSQYRASHGEGGPVVTLGENSRISRTVAGLDDDSYYITAPGGEALVDGSRRPDAGNRFVIIETVNGRQAVHLGGYSWLTSLVVAVVGSLLACVVLYFLARRLAARVPDERIVPLATTLDELAHDAPVTVQPLRRGRSQPAAVLTAAGPAADVERIERRTRIVTVGVVALLAVAGLVTAVG